MRAVALPGRGAGRAVPASVPASYLPTANSAAHVTCRCHHHPRRCDEDWRGRGMADLQEGLQVSVTGWWESVGRRTAVVHPAARVLHDYCILMSRPRQHEPTASGTTAGHMLLPAQLLSAPAHWTQLYTRTLHVSPPSRPRSPPQLCRAQPHHRPDAAAAGPEWHPRRPQLVLRRCAQCVEAKCVGQRGAGAPKSKPPGLGMHRKHPWSHL